MKSIEKVQAREVTPVREFELPTTDRRDQVRREIAEAFGEYFRQIEEIRARHGREARKSLN